MGLREKARRRNEAIANVLVGALLDGRAMTRGERHRAQKAIEAMPLPPAVGQCPFRTLLGSGTEMEPSLVLAVLGGQPEALTPDMLTEVVALLGSGGSVLLVSDRADLRDRAKREILAVVEPAMGAC